MVALTLTADFARLQRKLGWMALLLESGEVRERLAAASLTAFWRRSREAGVMNSASLALLPQTEQVT